MGKQEPALLQLQRGFAAVLHLFVQPAWWEFRNVYCYQLLCFIIYTFPLTSSGLKYLGKLINSTSKPADLQTVKTRTLCFI